MEVRLAKIISIVLQPLLIPSYTLLVIFNLNNYIALIIPPQYRQIILGIVVVTTFLFPALFILILYRRRIIKTLHMDQREERIIPLLITAIFFFLAYNLIRRIQLDEIYLRLFLGSFISVVSALIISLFWKISMHMMGVGGLVGALIGVSQVIPVDLAFWVMIAVFLSGLTGFARLKLKAHTPMQVYAGFLGGILVMLLVFRF
jgi:membrane-associated phospholipid phosphatase